MRTSFFKSHRVVLVSMTMCLNIIADQDLLLTNLIEITEELSHPSGTVGQDPTPPAGAGTKSPSITSKTQPLMDVPTLSSVAPTLVSLANGQGIAAGNIQLQFNNQIVYAEFNGTLLGYINKLVQQSQAITLEFSVSLGANQNYQMDFAVYNSNNTLVGTSSISPLIVNGSQQPLSENDLAGQSVTYVLSYARSAGTGGKPAADTTYTNVTIPVTIDAQGVMTGEITIQGQGAVVAGGTTLYALVQSLQQHQIPVSMVVCNFASVSRPTWWNVNIGSGTNLAQYAFTSNPWNSAGVVAADCAPIFNSITAQQWQQGINVLILGFEGSGALLPSLSVRVPHSFSMYIFDAQGDPIQGSPISFNASQIGTGVLPATLGSGPVPLVIGGQGLSQVVSTTYPAVMTFVAGTTLSVQGLSFANIA